MRLEDLNIQDALLTPNEWSRPQTQINRIKGIIWHWTANPGTTAMQNRNYFESRKNGNLDYGSAHYIVGLDGEIVRCLPDNEMGYHVGSKTYNPEALAKLSNYPNDCTIGIEMCVTDWDGRIPDKTLQSTIKLTAALLAKFGLTTDAIGTHQWVVLWKNCPKWFVDHPDDYEKAKKEVEKVMNGTPATPQTPTTPATTPLSWQQQQGLDSVAYLHTVGQISSPEVWTADKMLEPAPTWLVMTLIARSLGMKK